MSEGDKPLVTFALFAYNQAGFVRDAARSVLAQTYRPLEVIFSDDCSPDETFKILEEEASKAPHDIKVKLNRNPTNLGIGAHINHINGLAEGELVVAGAGDDISTEGRVATLVDAWVGAGRHPALLHSSCMRIDAGGNELGIKECPCLHLLGSPESVARNSPFVIGATEAWDRGLFDVFGPLADSIVHEDRALVFRAILLNRPIMYVKHPLVLYRQDVGVSGTYGAYNDRHRRRIYLDRAKNDVLQKISDLRLAPNPKLESILERELARKELALAFEESFPESRRIADLSRQAGGIFLSRMIVKKVVNFVRDRVNDRRSRL